MILFNKKLKKGNLKWIYDVCLYSLALVFLPAILSFCFITEKTSAKSYSVDSFLAHGLGNSLNNPNANSLHILSSAPYISLSNSVSSSDLAPLSSSYLRSELSSSKCVYHSYNSGFSTSSNLDYTFWDWQGYFLSPSYPFDMLLDHPEHICRTMLSYGYSSDSVTIPSFDQSSVPFNVSINVSSMLPYNFVYNNLYFSPLRSVDGVDYDGTFYLSDMFNNAREFGDSDYYSVSPYLHNFKFPLNFDSSKEEASFIELSGTLNFTSPLTSSEISNLRVTIGGQVTNFRQNTVFSSDSCSYSSNLDYTSFSFSCSVSLPYASSLYGLEFTVSSVTDLLFPTTSNVEVSFSNFFVTVNGDSSSGGYGGFSTMGSFPNAAPGVPSVDPDSANWLSSLTNLFNFSIFNPFAPIFNLFTDGQSCARIPIIAGMLHAESDEYCSWFPSSVRSVLTPVFSLASVMLLFGFIVRWLGSSSGNFFEDSKSEEVSNQGGRWGRFKRGGVK